MHAVYKTSDIRGTVWSMCFMRTRCSMDEYYPVVAMIINRFALGSLHAAAI